MTRTINDLQGRTFGRWLVVSFGYRENNVTYWKCICECLNEKNVRASELISGRSMSCGCLRKEKVSKDLLGMRFSNLVVIKKYGIDTTRHVTWLCKCDCGNTKIVSSNGLVTGNVKSCGCRRKNPRKRTI